MRRTLLASSLMALGLITAAAPAAAQAQTPLRISLNADIRSTNPGVNRDNNTDSVVLHFVEGLVAHGENAEVRPLLAEKVDVSDDGLTYTFTLRKGVKFHNGATLTAADVLWTWERYLKKETDWRCLGEFDGRNALKIESIKAPNDHTVVFTLNKPSALFLATMARTDCGMSGILHKDSVKADGSWDQPIGTGPFKLGKWERGQYISLLKFDDYTNRDDGKIDGYTGSKRPLVDEARFIVIPDAAAATAALLSGDLDIADTITGHEVVELKKRDQVTVATAPTMSMTTLLFQTRDPLLKDVKLRQAIVAALDSGQIVEAVTEGQSPPNNSVIPQGSAYYTDVQKKGFAYDPALARKLAKEAGYKGQEIVMQANKRYAHTYDAAVVAQAMLAAAGFNVRLDVMEWGTQLDRYNSGNFQMMSFPYSARLDPALSYEMVSGDKDKQPRKVWDNPEGLKKIAELMVVSDKTQRQKLIDELQVLFNADVPMVPLYNPTDRAAFRKDVEGYTPWAANKPRLWEVSKK